MMTAIRYGVMRGVYANEAGYGTAAVVYGVAKSARAEQQGLGAMMEVFIISFVTSSISGLAILVTGTWQSGATGPAAVTQAFNAALPMGGTGGWMVAVSVFLFGYSSLIGWGYYGEQFLEYLFGPRIITPYRWLYCLLIPLGAIAKVDVVWAWGDILNGLQVFPNVIGLIALSGLAAKYAASRGDSGSVST
jgi:AGCS family alanine or glycine:cation symporter